ncbi:glycosyltransferase family 2 protein [soil metagenome]
MAQLISIIVTVLNEEKTISTLLESVFGQTYPVHEVLISDGGSTDNTQTIIKEFQKKHPHFHVRLLKAPGNRSIGRNTAIATSTSNMLAITDAGCEPHRDWLTELVNVYEQFKLSPESKSDKGVVIAGYYDAKPKTAFEEAVIPYVLVMPDHVNPDTFLPATRSMLLEKKVWTTLSGFNEKLRWNEDYDFAQRLVKSHIPIVFAEKALVTWFPRENLGQFCKMIFHFAQGDAQAGIWRKKVLFIFVRYFLGFVLLILLLRNFHIALAVYFFLLGSSFYSIWAMAKNQKYVKKGLIWLPILQISSDLAVMAGSLAGIISS